MRHSNQLFNPEDRRIKIHRIARTCLPNCTVSTEYSRSSRLSGGSENCCLSLEYFFEKERSVKRRSMNRRFVKSIPTAGSQLSICLYLCSRHNYKGLPFKNKTTDWPNRIQHLTVIRRNKRRSQPNASVLERLEPLVQSFVDFSK